jgi:hypothetical protein
LIREICWLPSERFYIEAILSLISTCEPVTLTAIIEYSFYEVIAYPLVLPVSFLYAFFQSSPFVEASIFYGIFFSLVFLILSIFYWYLLSCLIIFIFKKLKEKIGLRKTLAVLFLIFIATVFIVSGIRYSILKSEGKIPCGTWIGPCPVGYYCKTPPNCEDCEGICKKLPLAIPHPFPLPTQCEKLRKEIDNLWIEANYCNQDSDCKAIQLGGEYIEFGCWRYVNKDYNTDEIFQKLDSYVNTCPIPVNKCMPAPESVCRENKCVSMEETQIDTSTWQTYRNEEYEFEFKYPKDWNLNFESSNYTEIATTEKENYLHGSR